MRRISCAHMSRRVVSSYVQIKFRESAGIRLCYERVFDTIHIMKRCSKCGVEQSPDQFYKAKGTRDGLRGDCKICFSKRARANYLANSEREIARVKQWQQANPDRVRAAQRKRRSQPGSKLADRAWHLKRKYGMTLKQYDDLLTAQEGRCAICEEPPRADVSLHIDHDHNTGVVRGLLCFRCNNALGDFADDGGRLIRAVHYLGPVPKDPELIQRLDQLKTRFSPLERHWSAVKQRDRSDTL